MDYTLLANEAGPRVGATQEWVFQVLRSGIVSGNIPDGTQLKQDEISAALSVSHIPVREALRRLEVQGLVTIQPNRGATVTHLDADTIVEMMEVRANLSVMLLKKSAPFLTNDEYGELNTILDAEEKETDIQKSEDLNYRFHNLLFSHSKNSVAFLFMDLIHANIDRYLRARFYGEEAMRLRSVKEHREIMAACRAKQYDRAADMLSDHILGAKELVPDRRQS